MATAATSDGRPAAALPWEAGTLLERLVDQLLALGVADVRVITRPDWVADLRPSLAGRGQDVKLSVSPTVAEDMRAVAAIARRDEGGGIVVANGDIVTHDGALARLVADPGVPTGILASEDRATGAPYAFRVRSARGRVVSAASPYHDVHAPNDTFLGALRVSEANRQVLGELADRLGKLVEEPLRDDWRAEAERKASAWSAAGGDEDLALHVAAATRDVPALLTAGLVRSGVHLGESLLRELFWARPLSQGAVELASERMAGYDEQKVLLDSAVKPRDGFFTTFFVSPYSKYIARWAARQGFTPNQITTVSLVIGLAAALAFATGSRAGMVAGAVLLQVAFTTDCVDGQLARYTRQFSKLGAWLDSIFDRSKEYLVFAGLAIGASSGGDPVWLLAAAAITLQTVRHAFDLSYGAAQHQVIGDAPQQPLEEPYDRPARPTAEEHTETPAPKPASNALRSWERLDRLPGFVWLKRMAAFPIGERFAVISITAALFDPRVTFVVLLAWGGFAACYSLGGRVLRSVAR